MVLLSTPYWSAAHFSKFFILFSKIIDCWRYAFKGSIGRTDLPYGDFKQIETSIRQRLYTLNDDFTVITGHGPSTTIGQKDV